MGPVISETDISSKFSWIYRLLIDTYAVIERDRVHDHESIQIVLVGDIITMPRDNVEGTVSLRCGKEFTLIFRNYRKRYVAVFEPRDWRQEVARVSKTIRTLIGEKKI